MCDFSFRNRFALRSWSACCNQVYSCFLLLVTGIYELFEILKSLTSQGRMHVATRLPLPQTGNRSSRCRFLDYSKRTQENTSMRLRIYNHHLFHPSIYRMRRVHFSTFENEPQLVELKSFPSCVFDRIVGCTFQLTRILPSPPSKRR